MEETHECCLCGKLFVGIGNNPWPITPEAPEYRCCDECNSTKVIPARINYQRDLKKDRKDLNG